MKTLTTVSVWLVIIGGLNWGLVGLFEYDLVKELLGGGDATAILAKTVYILVGLAAIVLLIDQFSGKEKA